MSDLRRPLLRYHGGKWKLAPWIIGLFPPHRVYVEPFGGGGSVLLRKERSYAEIYNDLDGEVVNVFRCARDHGPALQQSLRLTPFAREEFVLSYQDASDPVERARRTIIRSFMGFGSNSVPAKSTGFRANSSRSGTTPAGDWKNYADVFETLIDRLRGIVIENKDARAVMAQHDAPDTLHYVDPPYVHSTRSSMNPHCTKLFYRHEMNDDDHAELAEFLFGLRGRVILSGYESPLYEKLYSTWRVHKKIAHADGGRERTECLWISDNVETGRFL